MSVINRQFGVEIEACSFIVNSTISLNVCFIFVFSTETNQWREKKTPFLEQQSCEERNKKTVVALKKTKMKTSVDWAYFSIHPSNCIQWMCILFIIITFNIWSIIILSVSELFKWYDKRKKIMSQVICFLFKIRLRLFFLLLLLHVRQEKKRGKNQNKNSNLFTLESWKNKIQMK